MWYNDFSETRRRAMPSAPEDGMEAELIQVSIDSIRVSLVSPHRIVVLKDDDERFLPIWIGPFEAEAINIALQGTQPGRPLTHDLFKSLIAEVGGTPHHIVVADLRDDTFFARIVMDVNSKHLELDARPSDAIAIAVRLGIPIYVVDQVMNKASIRASQSEAPVEEEKLDAFRDLIEDLDLDSLGKGDTSPKED
jgi:bifunctional DNase/RNase